MALQSDKKYKILLKHKKSGFFVDRYCLQENIENVKHYMVNLSDKPDLNYVMNYYIYFVAIWLKKYMEDQKLTQNDFEFVVA